MSSRATGDGMQTALFVMRRAGSDTAGHIHLYPGLLYVDGKGVPQDVNAAHEYVVSAANRGNEGAKTALLFSGKQSLDSIFSNGDYGVLKINRLNE